MSDLNSLILQGVLTADPVITKNKCDFTVNSTRFIKSDGTRYKKTITVRVQITDRLMEDCVDILEKDRVVRVVGYLSQDDKGIFLAGTHIEFKARRKANLDG